MPSPPTRAPIARLLDALAFSGVWTAGAAAALCAAAGLALAGESGAGELAQACWLAGAGTVVVYAIDRLRDRHRDVETAPARSAFVARHRTAIAGLAALAAAACLPAALALPAVAWGLCAGVLALGLFHRRLKAKPVATLAYVSAAWVIVVVGLPATAIAEPARRPALIVATAVCIGLAITANAIASELRGLRFDAHAVLRLRQARRLALLATVLPLVVPPLRPLAWVGATSWISVALFRPDERYGLIVLDGALLVGGVAAAAVLAHGGG